MVSGQIGHIGQYVRLHVVVVNIREIGSVRILRLRTEGMNALERKVRNRNATMDRAEVKLLISSKEG